MSSFSSSPTSASMSNGDISLPQQIAASSVGALLTSLFVTPMDVVKIRLQSQVRPMVAGQCFLYSNGLMDHLCRVCSDHPSPSQFVRCEWYNRPGQFTGTLDALVKIVRIEGIRSLWSGLSPTMLSAVPATVFYFTLYDNLLHFLHDRLGGPRLWWAPLLAGSLARTAAVSVVSPLELVRTKMQSERISYRELASAVRTTARADGWRSLWRGWSATLLRDIPFSAIYWTVYELTKQRMLKWMRADRTSFGVSFTCGAISGSLAAVLTLPADVAKTHQQITLGAVSRSRANGSRATPGTAADIRTFAVMRELVSTKGPASLFTGLVPRVARVAPACAIMIGSYEHLKLFFAHSNRRTRDGEKCTAD